MKNASLIFILLILFSCNSEKKYNLLFILVDDLGWTDVSYNYSDFYETSHIDKLSETSMLFDNAYAASSVCSPTRAAIMTGKHPARVNITDWIPGLDPKNKLLLGPVDRNELPLEETTIAEVLRDNNYSTFYLSLIHI